MTRKNILRHEKAKVRKERKVSKNTGTFIKVLLIFLVVALIVLGGAFLYKKFMPKISQNETNNMYYTPTQTVESSSYKNLFVVNTIDGIKILNASGEETNEEVSNAVSPYVKAMKEPVFLTNDKTMLSYDIMGKSAVLFNEAGVIETYNFSGNIIKGTMSTSGLFAFIVEDSGSKAAVKVYSQKGQELFSWFSGKGYVSDVCLNNEKSEMAVVTNETINGEISSKVLLFTLDNTEPYMGKIIGNSFCMAVSFYGDNVLALCENGLYSVNKDNEIKLVYGFSGKKMKHFKFFQNGNVILLSENVMSEKYDAVVVNTKGKIISQFETDSFLDISDTTKNKFLVIKRKGVVSVNHRGKISDEINCEFEVKDAKYFKNKIAILSQDKIFFE